MALPERDEDYLQKHSAQVDLINSELDSALQTQSDRFSAMNTRASLLTGAASVLGTITATQGMTQLLENVSLGTAALAAIIGIYVAGVHWVEQVNPSTMANEAMKFDSASSATYRYAREKEFAYTARQKKLQRRARWVVFGYCILALGVVLSLALSVFGVKPAEIKLNEGISYVNVF